MLATDLSPTADPKVMRKGSNYYIERVCAGCGELSWMQKQKSGRYCTASCARKRSEDIGYKGRHSRIYVVRGKADHCIHRNAIGCTSTRFEWAHIHDTDPLDVFNYVPLCKSCHIRYDRAAYTGPRPSIQGRKHWRAKLKDEATVLGCKARHKAGETYAALAREFGVSDVTMRDAINGKTWALTRQNESLRAEQTGDAATRARQLADAYANRH